jgi:hypothetical protein
MKQDRGVLEAKLRVIEREQPRLDLVAKVCYSFAT